MVFFHSCIEPGTNPEPPLELEAGVSFFIARPGDYNNLIGPDEWQIHVDSISIYDADLSEKIFTINSIPTAGYFLSLSTHYDSIPFVKANNDYKKNIYIRLSKEDIDTINVEYVKDVGIISLQYNNKTNSVIIPDYTYILAFIKY